MAYFSKNKIIKVLNYVIFYLKNKEYANLGICKISGLLEDGLWFSNNYKVILYSLFPESIIREKLKTSVFEEFVLKITEYDSNIPTQIVLDFSESNMSFNIPDNYQLEYLNYNYAKIEDCMYYISNSLSYPRNNEKQIIQIIAKTFINEINSILKTTEINILSSQISMNFHELNYILGMDVRKFNEEYFSKIITNAKELIIEKYSQCSECKINIDFIDKQGYMLTKIKFHFGIELYSIDATERELFKRKILLVPQNIPEPKILIQNDLSNNAKIVNAISNNIKNHDLKNIFMSVNFAELDSKTNEQLLLIHEIIQKYENLKNKGFNPGMESEIDNMVEAFLNSIDGINNESMEELSLKAEIKGLTNYFKTQNKNSNDFNI